MTSVKCFMLEDTGKVRVWLRRFYFSEPPIAKCSGKRGTHDAMKLFIDSMDARCSEHGIGDRKFHGSLDDLAPPHDDPRWPDTCEDCPFIFPRTGEVKVIDHRRVRTDGEWQVFQRSLYRRDDTGEIMTFEDAPPGAMIDAWWMGENKGPDGKNLYLKLPNGHEWWVDGPSRDINGKQGAGWTRTGTPPNITARPSIWARQGSPDDWHGFLTNGVLTKC